MFDIKGLLGGLPRAIVDHQLLLIGVGTILYWLILAYCKGQSRKVWSQIDTFNKS
jgi:hypothetical protein